MRITGRHFKTSSSRQADGHTGQRSVCSGQILHVNHSVTSAVAVGIVVI